jgi:hypothetical protein
VKSFFFPTTSAAPLSENRFDYLVVSGSAHGRFREEPKRYATEMEHYRKPSERFKLLSVFPTAGTAN